MLELKALRRVRRRALLLSASLIGLVAACGGGDVAPLTPSAQSVSTGEAPPAGARYIGAVRGSSGSGCGVFGVKGSYEGALADLRNRAAELGGNFVKIENVIGPHDESGCHSSAFEIRGVLFMIAQDVPSPSGPSPNNAAECDPPCSPGFGCQAGTCTPMCNPPCLTGEVCSRRRICEPAPQPASAPVPAPASASASASAPTSAPAPSHS
jgi:hypothetical protein